MNPGLARWKVGFDVAVALVFTVFCLVVTDHIPPEDGERYNGWGVATIIVVGSGLLLQRRYPYVALAIAITGLAIYTVADFAGGPVYLAPLVPLYSIAQQGDRRRTWMTVVGTIVILLPFALFSENPWQNFVYFLAFAGWISGAVFLGTAHFSRRAYLAELEQRARYLEETREEEARRRVAEERLRIARDLHDVIAHGIATIHMQSGAALHVLDRQPEQAKPALTAIKQLSKQTLDELRSTVGVLRDDEDAPLAPTPGLDQLDTLVDNARGAGVTVNVDCEPRAAPLPAAVDVAAYRIVQEALTNVMRHAGSNVTATVTVRHTADEVQVEVVDDGRGAASSADAERSAGHGIAGMSERAITVGGRVTAGPHPGGGFRVLAHLPLSGTVVGSSTGATP
jgi:signal transduction histidine kinase